MMTTPTINIIVAIGKNNVIGKGNQLLWKISDDLKRFKQITSGHPIIMGRKTFESIGKPLPNRTNIIVTRNKDYTVEGGIVVSSLPDAIKEAAKFDPEIFIIGGGEIYKESIELADRLYLTLIDDEKSGDTFFPDYFQYQKTVSSEDKVTEDGLKYKFLVLEK